MRHLSFLWAIGVAQILGAWLVSMERQNAFAGPPLFVTNNLTNDRPGGRLVELDGATGQYERLVDNVSAPRGIVVGPNGNLFVASGHRVLEYSFDNGLQPTTFVAANSGGLQSPHGLTFGPDGNLYVTSFRQDLVVHRFDGETGTFIDRFASYPLEPGWGQDMWRNTFGVSVAAYMGADGDGSGVIDAGDYKAWKRNFGNTYITMPELEDANVELASPVADGFAAFAEYQSPISKPPVDRVTSDLVVPETGDKSAGLLLIRRYADTEGSSEEKGVATLRGEAASQSIPSSLESLRVAVFDDWP